MLNISKAMEGSALTLALEGRLDTTTSPELEEVIKGLDGVDTLIMDMAGLEYISSAGLRVLLSAQKVMNTKGGMKIKNATEEVMEIFEVTGFDDILTIE